MSRQTFCLSHWSKPVKFVLLPVKPGSYSLRLSVDARREMSLTSLPPGDPHLSVYQNSGLLIRAFPDGWDGFQTCIGSSSAAGYFQQ